MEILKQRTKLVFMVIFLAAGTLSAQDFTKIQKAFEKSYQDEKNSKFSDAANTLLAVYDEKSYEINLRLGWLYYNKGSFDLSYSYYTKALNLMPYSEEAKFGIVLPLAALGKWDDVLDQYKSILKIAPENTIAGYRTGLIYYNRKDYAKAEPFFKKVVDLYPFNYDGLLMYAWTNLQLGKTKEAKILFNKVLMLSPDDDSANEGLRLLK